MTFFETLEKKNNIHLTPQQKAAVLKTEGNNLLLACPGSGKTTVMVVKTAYLIQERQVRQESILTLTFSVASAADMTKRYRYLFGGEGPKFSTIHSFCFRIMQHAFRTSETGIPKENIEGDNHYKFNKTQVLAQLYEATNQEKPNEEAIETLASEISYIKNLLIPPSEYENHPFDTANLEKIYLAYAAFKEQYHLYDFDDMLLIAYTTLKKDVALRTRLMHQYKYIQVDEAQDNSKVQNMILKLLIHPQNNLFMVADDDQTIYEWRGAYPEGILKFEETYPGATVLKMEENFRSTNNIVSVASQFIKANKNRYDKSMMTHNAKGIPINVQKVSDEEAQFKWIIENIQRSKEPLEEHAILYRNNLTAVLFAEMLSRHQLPFTIKGHKGHFFKHWVVEDIRNFMMFAKHPSDLRYFDTIYYKNSLFLSRVGYENAKKHKGDFFKALIDHGNLQEFQKNKIYPMQYAFQTLLKKPADMAIVSIEEDLGYLKWLETGAKSRGMSPEGVANILATLKHIGSQCGTVDIFLKRLSQLEALMQSASNPKGGVGIVLSTVHSSKGLEFDHVYLVDLLNAVFPGMEALKAAADGKMGPLESERRLFYVAKTRARTYLNIIETKKYNGRDVEPSLFVEEVKNILDPERFKKKEWQKKEALKAQEANNRGVQGAFSKQQTNFYSPANLQKPTKNTSIYLVGDRVNHPKYGKGIVLEIKPTIIIVEFITGEIKKFGKNVDAITLVQ